MVTIKKKFTYLSDGSIDTKAWLSHIQEKNHLPHLDLIHQTTLFLKEKSEGLTTFYGQPCIEQGMEMAEILLEMKLDQHAVSAAMIWSMMEHSHFSLEIIKEKLGEETAKLVHGVLQMNVLNDLHSQKKSRNNIQLDRLRKIFLAMVSDTRVVLIKLAERLCIMRGIKHINPDKRKHIAEETMDIYAPLANRLGIGQLKWELEDIAFHYINPETYKSIATFLAERRDDREKRIQDTIHHLKKTFLKSNIKANITGRAKHIYSIYLKAQRKHVQYKDIYDYSAVRVLVPTLEDCYTALSIVHTLFEDIPEEFDDYISHPKPNDYRSIHTAVKDMHGKNLEIQIRTLTMHEEAEHGVAAHWVYKENKTPAGGYETKITFLRQLLAWHKEIAYQYQNEEQKKNRTEILEDTVYVFTPQGDIIDLPLGSTPLDFAYHIHSELGHRCRGAKIKGHIVPLTHSLRTGDQVEIITSPQGRPSRDWLNKESGYLISSRARAKVAHWFKQQDIQAEINKQPAHSEHMTLPAKKTEVFPILKPLVDKQPIPSQIAGVNDVLTRVARCCKPIPGDLVIGYITRGRGVTIHRKNCNNILNYESKEKHRLIEVNWNNNKRGNYYVDLHISGSGQHDLLKEVTSLLVNAKIHLISLNSITNPQNNMILIKLTIQIQESSMLQNIMNHIQQLPKVMDVRRVNKS